MTADRSQGSPDFRDAATTGLDVERLAWSILAARSTTGQWKGSARATAPTQWDRIMAKRVAAVYDAPIPTKLAEAPR